VDYIFKQLINGQCMDPANGSIWDLVNPAHETVIAQMPFGDGEDALLALEAAAAAFPGWAGKTPYERADVLKHAAQWLRDHNSALARITSEESGKPLREASGEWTTSANFFEWFAEEGKRSFREGTGMRL
jgi:succinate-semialdehyde dehydrogenase/glutarate-semialdehyde dehydrogenase